MSIQREDNQDIELNRALEDWGAKLNGKPLVIAVIGKSGVGKSTLINNFLGLKNDDLCATGDGASTTTMKIVTRESKKQNISVQMIDTPGLGGINEISMVEVCKDLVRRTADQKFDILLYCVSKHPSSCIDTTDVEILRTIALVFGQEIWLRTILVLTFADSANSEQDTQICSYAKSFQKALDKTGVVNISVQSGSSEKEEPSSIPVIPVSWSSIELPHSSDWISQLLIQALKKSNPKTEHTSSQSRIRIVQATEFAGSVMAGTAVGAAVGAAIGAPFFGIGIIIGPVVGAAIGAVAGSILPIATKLAQRR